MLMRRIAMISVLALLLFQSGCLKTRSQIKGEEGEPTQQNANSDDAQATEQGGAANAGGSHYKYEELSDAITRNNGRLDDLEHQLKTQQNAADVKEYATRLEGRIQELEKNQVLMMSEIKDLKDRADAAPVTRGRATNGAAGASAGSGKISEGFTLLKSKEYDSAADFFKNALAKNPKGKDAATANYGLGEAEYGRDNYKKAIVAYSKVQEVQPKSPLVPPALYKIALSFEHLNMHKEAKGFFSEIVERFPHTPEGKKAKAHLKE